MTVGAAHAATTRTTRRRSPGGEPPRRAQRGTGPGSRTPVQPTDRPPGGPSRRWRRRSSARATSNTMSQGATQQGDDIRLNRRPGHAWWRGPLISATRRQNPAATARARRSPSGRRRGSRRRRQVEAALFLARLPTTSGRRAGLAGADRARAGGAADRREAPVVQRIDRHTVCVREGARPAAGSSRSSGLSLSRPRRGRRRRGRRPAVGRLVGAQARDPARALGERAAERLDLADAAAGVRVSTGSVEPIDALGGHQGFQRVGLRIDGADATSIAAFGLFPNPIGLRKQPAGVDGNDLYRDSSRADVMQDDLALETEAGR